MPGLPRKGTREHKEVMSIIQGSTLYTNTRSEQARRQGENQGMKQTQNHFDPTRGSFLSEIHFLKIYSQYSELVSIASIVEASIVVKARIVEASIVVKGRWGKLSRRRKVKGGARGGGAIGGGERVESKMETADSQTTWPVPLGLAKLDKERERIGREACTSRQFKLDAEQELRAA